MESQQIFAELELAMVSNACARLLSVASRISAAQVGEL